MSTKALLLYDGSRSADNAIKKTSTVFNFDSVVVTHIWEPAATVDPEHPWLMYAHLLPSVAELDRIAAERSVELAKEGAAKANALGLQAEPLSQRVTNSIWETAIDVANEREVAVIVVGSRRHSRLAVAVLGSVTHGLLMHVDFPVLVIPVGNLRTKESMFGGG